VAVDVGAGDEVGRPLVDGEAVPGAVAVSVGGADGEPLGGADGEPLGGADGEPLGGVDGEPGVVEVGVAVGVPVGGSGVAKQVGRVIVLVSRVTMPFTTSAQMSMFMTTKSENRVLLNIQSTTTATKGSQHPNL